ncbi:uncharacterized protein [Branchiostoma lanceolatum]|uniref:uncharacterized protein n=1 Tax=Branchiostoma lanceolatum TaxID=7740 RepID=UPI0034538258
MSGLKAPVFLHLALLLLLLLLLPDLSTSTFLNFKKGVDYKYRIETESELSNVDDPFHLGAQVSFQHLVDTDAGQECLLKVHSMIYQHVNERAVATEHFEFSKWFSFEISGRGEIFNVWYPPDEKPEVINIKKGIISFFAGKLHHNHEVGRANEDRWSYVTNETGHEGDHQATYSAEPHEGGVKFTKQREGHPAFEHKSDTRLHKELYFKKDGEVPHRVLIKEKFSSPKKNQPGYDVHKGTRGGNFVNEPEDIDIPEMSTSAESEFTLIGLSHSEPPSRPEGLYQDAITVSQRKHKVPIGPPLNLTEVRKPIQQDLTCLRKLIIKRGSNKKDIIPCYTHLRETLERLTNEDLVTVVDFYFNQSSRYAAKRLDKYHLMDAVADQHTDFTDDLVVDYVLLADEPDKDLIERVLVHYVAIDEPIPQRFIRTLENLAFFPDEYDEVYLIASVNQRCLLVLGAIVENMLKHGHHETADRVVGRMEADLGVHDPWEERQKRSTMTDEELEFHDFERVTLLEALGNAAQPRSFEHLLSYTNQTTAPPLLRRAGLHAMRGYHHQAAADRLHKSATMDENEQVRYEANMYYQAHPHGRRLPDDHPHVGPGFKNVTSPALDNPLLPMRQRTKRGFWEGIKFDMCAPGVAWKKILGSTSIGASFGVTVANCLNFNIAPLEGDLKIEVHDEVYARVHLGILGVNLDLFVVRLCFIGHTWYNLNLLQEFEVGTVTDITSRFDDVVGKIFGAISSGVSAVQSVVTGETDIIDLFEALKSSLEALPGRIGMIKDTVIYVLDILGKYDPNVWPPTIRPMVKAVLGIVNKINKIRNDITTFYNLVTMTVSVDLPWAADQIWDSIVTLVGALDDVFSNPKGALADIFKCIFRFAQAAYTLFQRKNQMMAIVYPNGHFPDWFDLRLMVTQAKQNLTTAMAESRVAMDEWIARAKKDPVAAYIGMHESRLKQIIKTELDLAMTRLHGSLDPLDGVADDFRDDYDRGMTTVSALKDAYVVLDEHYKKVKAMYVRLFGARAHVKFPRKVNSAAGGGCPAGFYPTTHNGKYFNWEGIDLEATASTTLYSPFTGMMKKNVTGTVTINCTDTNALGMMAFITNLSPNATLFADPNATEVEVFAGQPIGTVLPSGCNNHIHFAVYRTAVPPKWLPGGWMDVTKLLEPRGIELPVWTQDCDDYKLVWKFQTLATGSVVGLAGRQNQNTSPTRTASQPDTSSIKTMSSRSGRKKKRKKRAMLNGQQIGMNQQQGLAIVMPGTNGSGPSTFQFGSTTINDLLNVLQALGMNDSYDALNDVADSLTLLLLNKPCKRADTMTFAQLQNELSLRYENSSGTRDELIARMKTSNANYCPFLTMKMPPNVFCTFSDLCLGISCCVELRMWNFFKTVKAHATFNISTFTFSFGIETAGIDPFLYEYQIISEKFWGETKEIDTGIDLDFTGESPMRLKMRIMMEYYKPALFYLTFSVGTCGDECLPFFVLLNRAPIPLPTRGENGTVVWPTVNMTTLAEGAMSSAQLAQVTAEALTVLGLPIDLLQGKLQCALPNQITEAKLRYKLTTYGLSLIGNNTVLTKRLKDHEMTCKNESGTALAKLPLVPWNMINYTYCRLESSCLDIRCCIEVGIPYLNWTWVFNAKVHLDVCNYEIVVGFETLEQRLLFLNDFAWGVQQNVKLAEGVTIEVTVARDNVNYTIDVGARICADYMCYNTRTFIIQYKAPIPECDMVEINATTVQRFLTSAGSQVHLDLVDVIIRSFGLNDIFVPAGQTAEMPGTDTNSTRRRRDTTSCDLAPDFSYLPAGSTCEVNSACHGLDCVVDMNLLDYTTVSAAASISFDYCNLQFNIHMGNWSYTLTLMTYTWGQEQEKKIGDKLQLKYSIRRNSDPSVYVVNFEAKLCINVTCTETVQILNNLEIPEPVCNASLTDTLGVESVEELEQYVQENGLAAGDVLPPTARETLLNTLGLTHFFEETPCEPPRVLQEGYAGRDSCPDMNNPTLPEAMACSVQSDCLGVSCCVDMDLRLLTLTTTAAVELDICNFTLNLRLGQLNFHQVLFLYQWGSDVTININDTVVMTYSIRQDDAENRFAITLKMRLSIDGQVTAEYYLLRNSFMPQVTCDPNAPMTSLSGQGERSIAGFIQALNITEDTEVGDYAILGLLSYNAIAGVFDLTTSYSPPLISGGFSESCSGVAWPQPPSGHECQLTSSTCTGITCYGQVDLDLVTFNSKTWMDFDPCNYEMTVGVSNKDYTFSLLRNYTWGELRTVEFGTVFRVNYAIDNKSDNETFVLDFSLSICKDSNVSNCAEIVFLEGTEVPQPSCFTQNTWTPTQGGVAMQPADAVSFFQNAAAVSPVTTNVFREATMRYMGLVGVFPEGDTCTGNTMGWTGQDLCGDTTLPSLPGDTSCTVSEECYRMDCCMTLDLCSIWEVRPNFHVNFDPCTYSLSVGMGTWTSEFNLYQYTWGQTKTLTIGTLLTFSYKIEKSDEDSAFLMDFAFRLSCDGATTTTNIALMEGTKVPYKTDCEAVVLPDTVEAFLTEQGGQVEKAGQDYVMRGLGLANTFAGHSCTHQTDGWQGLDSYPENIQLPALPDSVNCELNDVWIGASCCMDFDLKVATYSTGVMLAFDPCTFTLTASLGGTTFTELDMYRYTWGSEEGLTVGQEIQLNYTINYNKDTQEYTLSFSVTTCVDSCTAPLPIFSQTTISLPTCMDQVSVLPGAGTIQDLVTQYGDTLGDAALQPAYRYWGLFGDLYPLDTCVVPTTSPSCDLDLGTLNLPDAYTYSLHNSCTGIETCVECDLQVLQRSSKVAVDIDGCAMTMTLTFATLTKVIRLYEAAWDQEQVWLLGTLYQIKYTISNDVASGNYQIDLEIVTCLDPDSCQSCGHVMQNSNFPKPTCDSDENCELDPSNPGQTFTAYLGSFPSDVTAEAATAGLENVYRCQGVPDMIMETCSTPPVDTPTCDWSPALSNGCYHTDDCSGVTCCIDFNYQVDTKSTIS